MTWLSRPSVMLTVRGTTIPSTIDETRTIHNQTAGSDAGVAAARALGDLSHKVYTPLAGASEAASNELLFIDVWEDAERLGTFFGDDQVQQGASMLFAEREATVWMPAEDAYGFELAAPAHLDGHFVGLAGGPVDDPSAAIKAFRSVLEPQLGAARGLGQISHQTYVSLPMPGAQTMVLGVDVWADAQGMGEFYATLGTFDAGFSAPPDTSVWESGAGGGWREW